MFTFSVSHELAPLKHASVNEIAVHYPPKTCGRFKRRILPSGRMLTANTVVGEISKKLTA